MAHHMLVGVPVHMVVSGSVVERCDTDEIPPITAARLRSRPAGLAVGSVNLNRLHHFRTFGQHPRARYPALAVRGMWAPDPADIESCSDSLVAGIRAARTDIPVVSLGKSRQERWGPMSVTPTVRHARSSLPRTQNARTWQRLVRHEVHMVTGDTTNRESDELPLM
jgi:hypothetical protein